MVRDRALDTDRLLRAALLAAIALLFLSLSLVEIRGTDFWWQLRAGEWVVEHRAVPDRDEFTYTALGHEWIEVRWLFFALSYLGWGLGGPALLILGQSAIVAAAFLAVVWPSRKIVLTLPGAFALILGILAASGRFVVRPEIVTFLFTAIYLVLLDGRSRGRYLRLVWVLPLLQILWNNSHTLFILGPILGWLFVVGSVLRRWRARDSGPVRGLAAVAATLTLFLLVNAYGLRGVLLPVLLFREMHAGSVVGRNIVELRSPFVLETWTWDLWACALLLLVCAATFVLGRRRLDPARVLIASAFAYLAGQSVRNVALFGFVATWATLRNLDEAEIRAKLPRRARTALRLAAVFVVVLAAWYQATDRYATRADTDHRFGLGIVPWNQPSEVTDFLLRNDVAPQIFHSMSDGPYLVWAARDRFPVFIDGRNEVMGEPLIAQYLVAASGAIDWEAFAERWRINAVMIHREDLSRLADVLRGSAIWVLVHVDARDLLFVRDIPRHAELIRRFRIDPKAPFTPRGPEPVETVSGWRERIGSVGRPWYTLGIARSFLLVGATDAAAFYLERAVRSFPDHRLARIYLAVVRRSRSRSVEADPLLEGLTLSRSEQAWADEMLAGIHMMEGNPAEAVRPLESAVAAAPDQAVLWAKLGRARFEARSFPRAAEAYRRALMLPRADPVLWVELGHACVMAGDVRGALEAYRNALRHDPSLYQVSYTVGMLLLRSGDTASAADSFREALRVRPDYEPARKALEEIR